jgi:hypothetical protein
MTTEVAVPEVVDAEIVEDEEPLWPIGPERRYYGYVIIEWPAPRGKDGDPRVMPGWGCSIFDAVTGRQISTVEKLAIPAVTADAQGWVIADLVMFADDKGMPLLFPERIPDPQGRPGHIGSERICLDDEGKVRTGVFAFIVAEMRVRGSAPVVEASDLH